LPVCSNINDITNEELYDPQSFLCNEHSYSCLKFMYIFYYARLQRCCLDTVRTHNVRNSMCTFTADCAACL